MSYPSSVHSLVFAQKHRPVAVPEEVRHQLKTAGVGGRLRATRIDLNNDGRRDLIVQAGCSAVGNCSTLVFTKTSNGYKELLSDEAQMFWIGQRRSYGYHELVFSIHESAYDSVVLTYRFDGHRYSLKKCVAHSYAYLDKIGRHRTLKLPKIATCTRDNLPDDL